MVGHHPEGAVVQTNVTVSTETLSHPKCFKKDCSMNPLTRWSLVCPEMLSMAVTWKQCFMEVASKQLLIINGDSSDSKSKPHLAART